MRSRRVTGRNACDGGIATGWAPDGELEAATDALVDELGDFVRPAQRTAKKLLKMILRMPHCCSRSKPSAMGGCSTRGLSRRGVEAFAAKRKPKFREDDG
jgi:2-oxoglutaroyl-CoA hydrolase